MTSNKLPLLFATLVTAIVFVFVSAPISHAVTAADWRAGDIISDSLFYDNNSMTVDQVQSFLNQKNPSCDTWGTQPATEFGRSDITHAQYAQAAGWDAPPYICLKDYYQVPRSDTIINNYNSTASRPSGSISAAQIIKNAAETYRVSPKALIVLLHKESKGPLTLDRWPLQSQYKSSMGYACRDTAPCDPQYAGFYNQVTNAAKRIQTYKLYPNNYRHRPFAWNEQVYYNPNLSGCGYSRVYIEGYATAGLYNYTPYQPNQAALNNMYGTGDSCSAYGNRNFWRVYADWFGNPNTPENNFTPLNNPRWMQIKGSGVTKIDVTTGQPVGTALAQGQQIKFVDKILVDGKWYLRTEYNHNDGGKYGVEHANVEEIPYVAIQPEWMTFTTDGHRSHPASRIGIAGDRLAQGTSVKVVDTITVNGNLYYRTEYNHNNNQDYGIHSRYVTGFAPVALESPRNFCSNSTINKINPQTGAVISSLSGLNQIPVNKKTLINGIWYYQSQADNGTLGFFDRHNLKQTCYVPFEDPRNMQLNKDATRINPYTNEPYDSLSKGQVISLSTKILINNEWFYRTTHNTQNNIDAVIPASAFSML